MAKKTTKYNKKSQNNLVPFKSGEERAKEAGSAGGTKSAETKKKYKTMKELAKKILATKAPQKVVEDIKAQMPDIDLEDDEMTIGALVLLGQLSKSLVEKDTKASEFVRDTAGEKPSDKTEVTGIVGIGSDIEKIKELRNKLGARKRETD